MLDRDRSASLLHPAGPRGLATLLCESAQSSIFTARCRPRCHSTPFPHKPTVYFCKKKVCILNIYEKKNRMNIIFKFYSTETRSELDFFSHRIDRCGPGGAVDAVMMRSARRRRGRRGPPPRLAVREPYARAPHLVISQSPRTPRGAPSYHLPPSPPKPRFLPIRCCYYSSLLFPRLSSQISIAHRTLSL